MCYRKTKCQRPKELKGKAENCTPQQIRKCHGDARKHICTSEKK
jgi:hypothetical protein